MKIAFTHNLRKSASIEEAEFDNPETVDAIAKALEAGGHEVIRMDISESPAGWIERLHSEKPDLVFNTAEGKRGRAREALAPALFEDMNLPFTGSDAYSLVITLDKWLTKLIVASRGIPCPRGELIGAGDLPRIREEGVGIAFPLFAKPNFEGSSKGIDSKSVIFTKDELDTSLSRLLTQFPEGILVEEFIQGRDIAVGFIDGLGEGGVLCPVEYTRQKRDESASGQFNIYDYAHKNTELSDDIGLKCPADVPPQTMALLKTYTAKVNRVLGIRDLSRCDFRVDGEGRVFFLEINALPSLEPGAGLFAASQSLGLSYAQTIEAVVASARRRYSSRGVT